MKAAPTIDELRTRIMTPGGLADEGDASFAAGFARSAWQEGAREGARACIEALRKSHFVARDVVADWLEEELRTGRLLAPETGSVR